MANMNLVFLMGNLASDPELRYTPNGNAVADFRLAVDRFQGKKETAEKVTDFFNVVVWGKLAELCSQYLKKGRMAVVEGRLQTRNYTDREGNRRDKTEIIGRNVQFLGGRGDSVPRGDSAAPSDMAEEEIPF